MPTQKILYVEDHPESQQAISELLPVIFDCTVDIAVDVYLGLKKPKMGLIALLLWILACQTLTV